MKMKRRGNRLVWKGIISALLRGWPKGTKREHVFPRKVVRRCVKKSVYEQYY